MTRLAAILILTLVWAALGGNAHLPNLVLGACVAWAVLTIVRGQRPAQNGRVRLWKLVPLGLLFLRELAVSAWTVARLVVTPKMRLRPGIFAFPLTVTRDIEITLLANLITLTPGTLSVDVSPDRKILYVHALDCSDPDAQRKAIASGFERRILEAFR